MLPIRDDIRARNAPIATLGLLVLNIGIFVMCAMMPEQELEVFLFRYGFIPAKLFSPENVAAFYRREFGLIVAREYSLAESVVPMLTCMFLHGGWIHVLGNMWMLWIFGDNVEDCLGHVGFVLFYVACGLASSVVHYIANPASPVVTVGASGAIAGVMGAYMLLYPHARVLTLLPVFFFVYFVPLPAVTFLFFWFVIQVLSGMVALNAGGMLGGVAWWAHIGGFVMGFAFVLVTGIRAPRRPSREYERSLYAYDRHTGRFGLRPRRPAAKK